MANKTYRFRFVGPSAADVSRELAGAQVVGASVLLAPVPLRDYTIAEERRDELIGIMAHPHGWEYVGQV